MLINVPAGLVDQQARHFQLGIALGDIFPDGLMLAELLAKCFACLYTLTRQLKATLACTNQSHAVVHTTWGQTALCDFKPPSLAEQKVLCGHADISERHLGMPNRCIVITQSGQRS